MKNIGLSKIEKLIEKGVKIHSPRSLEIGDEVDISRISGDDVVIHSGCKIFGADTLILEGVKLGYEAPVTVDNCQVGPEVELKGGYFNQSVFLEKAKLGMGAHVREATILEEQASIAHTVALKHTILFPFVTLGSLINFCDCLMAGGTSRKNHSEVGSSYIHFNFTPSQDKATASLIGDVPRGVMLNQKPIFLGGQGGLVGPCRLEYGLTAAAGAIVRKDELRSNRIVFGGAGKEGSIAFTPGRSRNDKRIIKNNLIYIGNLIALQQWYGQVRSLFVSNSFPQALLQGLQEKVDMAIEERINRLEAVILMKPAYDRNSKPSETLKQRLQLYERWSEVRESLTIKKSRGYEVGLMDGFLEKVLDGISKSGKDYVRVIQGLNPADAELGTQWLLNVIDDSLIGVRKIIPSFF
ncbi:MAG: protein GlmU [Desulfobacterales bacterium]|nr:MAG: protein GlmU [Desulfobacterales bacterium]